MKNKTSAATHRLFRMLCSHKSKEVNALRFSIIWLMFSTLAQAQTIDPVDLDSCHQWARQHYPLTTQIGLLEITRDLTLKNISSGNLPQWKLIGKATYQSEVTEIPIAVPGIDIPVVPHDQYNAYVEVNQPLTGFKTTKLEKEVALTNHDIKNNELKVSLYQLYGRVNTLYFGILLLDAQMEQIRISSTDILDRIEQLNHAKAYGTVLQSDIDQLRAESLRLDQQIFATRSQKNQLITILELLTGRNFSDNSQFKLPDVTPQTGQMHRPELDLFELQKRGIDQQKSLFQQQIKPQLSLFVQGGYGRPALNFLDDQFSPYFIGGLRFTWDLTSQYNKSRKMEIWDVQKRMIDAKAETFKLNTQMQLSRYNEEIRNYQKLLTMDQEIIDLRTSIKETAAQQLAHGLMTPVDYMTLLHEEEKARQSRALNEILLLQSYYNWQYENGN